MQEELAQQVTMNHIVAAIACWSPARQRYVAQFIYLKHDEWQGLEGNKDDTKPMG